MSPLFLARAASVCVDNAGSIGRKKHNLIVARLAKDYSANVSGRFVVPEDYKGNVEMYSLQFTPHNKDFKPKVRGVFVTAPSDALRNTLKHNVGDEKTQKLKKRYILLMLYCVMFLLFSLFEPFWISDEGTIRSRRREQKRFEEDSFTRFVF